MIEATKVEENKYELRFNLQPLADQIGIPKEKLVKLMADHIMKRLELE